jgi:hypothetical protein
VQRDRFQATIDHALLALKSFVPLLSRYNPPSTTTTTAAAAIIKLQTSMMTAQPSKRQLNPRAAAAMKTEKRP